MVYKSVLHLLSPTRLLLHSHPKSTKQCHSSVIYLLFYTKFGIFYIIFKWLWSSLRIKNMVSKFWFWTSIWRYNVILMTNGCIFVCKSDMSGLNKHSSITSCTSDRVSEESIKVFFLLRSIQAAIFFYLPLYSGINFGDIYILYRNLFF